MVHFRNGTETVHLQWSDSLQRIETGGETFREKRFENYFATVLQRYLQVETIYSVQESFEGIFICMHFLHTHVHSNTKAQNKWYRIAICYPNFRNCYTKPTLQFATQNYTQTNKKYEELQYKIFVSITLRKILKIATHRKNDILSPEHSATQLPDYQDNHEHNNDCYQITTLH
jgi:hypothetical protein